MRTSQETCIGEAPLKMLVLLTAEQQEGRTLPSVFAKRSSGSGPHQLDYSQMSDS